jgi:ribosomal protein S18 acetylase RimI-like enzyme
MKRPTVSLARNRTSYERDCARGGLRKKRAQAKAADACAGCGYRTTSCGPRAATFLFGRRSWLADRRSRYNGSVAFGVRESRKSDFDTLWRIDQACFDPQLAYSRPELAFYMRRPGSFTLVAAEDSGEARGNGGKPGCGIPSSGILGFILAESRRKSGHIITIDVIAEARRAGVGSALLRAAEEQLLRAGATAVALETPVNNEAAIRFYKQKGYFVERTVAGYYSNQMDALVMTKELARPVVG